MRILITTEFYYPYAGGSIFLQRVAEGLVAKGHQVTIATTYLPERESEVVNGVKIKQFALSGNSVKGIVGDSEAYKAFLTRFEGDVMINFAANIWSTDLAFEVLPQLRLKKILTTPGMSKINNRRYKSYYQNEYLPALKQYDKIVYTSSLYHDKLYGDSHGAGHKAVIIPNGAGSEFLQPTRNFKERYGITTKYLALSVSNHFIPKGHISVIRAFLKAKRKDTTLVFIGERPKYHGWYSCYPICELAAKFFPAIKSLHGISREDVVSAFQEADVFLFGSKIECSPLVMPESLAAKTPFITTDVGNVRENSPPVQIVTGVQEMAKVMNRLLDGEAERERLGEEGFELWQEKYTWEKIINQYEDVCKKLLQ